MGPDQPALRETHRGMSYGYLARAGDYASPETLAEVDRMADLGVRWVALHVSVVQDAFSSTVMYRDFRRSPSDHELEGFTRRCHERGVRVMLKTMIECRDSAWQGTIRFPQVDEQLQGLRSDYWTPWFENLTACLVHYGRLAERAGVELICLGCELDGAVREQDHWRRLIDAVRGAYSGPLTYDTGHRVLEDESVDWYKALDMLSVSFYFPAAARPGASALEMTRFLAPRVEQFRGIAERLGLPVVFGECGCRSRAGAAMDPGDYRLPGPYSGEEQANFLEALLSSFWPEPWWRGVYWWKWEEQQRRPQYEDDPAGDKGFTLQGKPAEAVMRRWYARDDRA